MSEFSSPHPESQPIDWELARRVIGADLLGEPDTPLDKYDERRQIAQDVQAAEEAMRVGFANAARAAKMPVDEAAMQAWRASTPAEIAQLRADMAPQRRIASIIRGFTDLVADVKQHDAARGGVPLRPHQHPFMFDTSDFMLYAPRTPGTIGKAGIIKAPPGIGKTATLSKIVSWAKYHEDPADPTGAVILVPTTQIRDQTMGMQGERGLGKFAPHLRAKAKAYPTDRNALQSEVIVMCNASFDALCRRGEMPDRPLLVVDEVDTVLGDSTMEYLAEYMQNKVAIGLSATTETAKRSAYELFPHEITNLGFTDAIHDGLLAPMTGFLRRVEPKINKLTLPADPAARRAALRRAYLEEAMEDAKGIIREAVEAGDGVIVCCPRGDDIGYAYDYAAELRNVLVHEGQGTLGGRRWINAMHIGGSSERQTLSERGEFLIEFDNGDIDVVTFVSAIGRGYDSPRAKVYINFDSTTSSSKVVQGVGRISRLIFDENGVPKRGRAYDYEDPFLGAKQQTCLDVLGTESGEPVDHDPDPSLPPPPGGERHTYKGARAEVVEAKVSTVATLAVGHEVEVEPPSTEEIDATLDIYSGNPDIQFGEACRILGVSPPTLKNILQKEGYSPTTPTIKLEDVRIILEIYPGLQAPKLPKQGGYIAALDLSKRMQERGLVSVGRSFNTVRYAITNGFIPQRFTDENGKVGFYFDEEMADLVIAHYQENHGRRQR